MKAAADRAPREPQLPESDPQSERREATGSRHEGSGQTPLAGAVAVSDRAADADLLVDVPHLTVEELSLEVEASPLLNRVKLDAKGLELGLFLKADLGGLTSPVAGGRRGADIDARPGRARARDATRVRNGLRELLGSTRDATRELSDQDVQQQLRGVHESAREAYAHLAGAGEEPASGHDDSSGDDRRDSGVGPDDGSEASRPRAAGQRALQFAKQGGKAAGLTAAGLAGGALLESRRKPDRRLPIPRRRNRAQAIAHDIRRRLP
jgi:hypothetical protein